MVEREHITMAKVGKTRIPIISKESLNSFKLFEKKNEPKYLREFFRQYYLEHEKNLQKFF